MVLWKTENDQFESTNILLFLHKWRKPLIFVSLIAIVASVIFSSPYFITPKFESTVILYPAATNAISKALLTENSGIKEGILDFGEDEETEQLLQILHSNRIREKIISKYQLMQHYDIDTTSSYRLTHLYKEYESNISFKRTEFMAVKITVLDKDPQTAADIANDITELLDSTKNEMQKQRAERAYEIVREQYFKLRDEVSAMEDSLTVLRSFGVHDYESQAEMINRQLAMELAKGNEAGIKRLEKKLETLAKYGGPYVSIRDALEHEKKQLSMLRAKYEEAKTDALEVLPAKFVVNSAYKAERKTYPIRWLIMVVTTLSALLFTLILLLIIENINTYFPGTFKFNNQYPGIPINNNRKNAKDPPLPPREPPHRETRDQIIESVAVKSPKHQKTTTQNKEIENTRPTQKKSPPQKTEESEQTGAQETKALTEKNDNQMARYFTNTNILKLHFKWKIHLSVIILLGILLAVFFSSKLFITPQFKSYALLYPTNLEAYSEESESEQMLQWLQSREIMDEIITTFDLGKRYGIERDFKYYQSTVEHMYSENIHISKTPYEAILIEAFDADPRIACNIVDSIVVFLNKLVLKNHSEKYHEALVIMKNRLDLKGREMDSVAKELYELRTKYGIFDYPNQSREVTRGYLRTVDGDNSRNINTKEVLRLKESIEQKGGEWTKYNDRYFDLIAEYGSYKIDYEWQIVNSEKKITYTTMITKPTVADKKSTPVRWIIVLLTALGVWFTAFLAIIVFENYDSIKRNF